jgi:predicted RNase H-like nuclease
VAGSVICYMGGGVQPANRAKRGLFDDDAPVWRFKAKLGAKEDPELSRITEGGLFIMEVFPALALATFNHAFFRRLKGPRYNPASKGKFRSEDWLAVIETVRKYAQIAKLDAIEAWAEELSRIHPPCKADQDRLDSVLCALVGYHWQTTPRENSIMIGDLTCGYMIAPVDSGTRQRLEKSAARHGVPCG